MSHLRSLLAILFLTILSNSAHAWWNAEWTLRKKITVDATSISEPVSTSTVLVRLHDGNFQFLSAKEDGSDIRFIAADDKTSLAWHIEKYDSLLNEAYVWVKADDAKKTYDSDSTLIFHFNEKGTAPVDSSASAVTATGTPISVEGSIIGSGIRLDGSKPITLPADFNLPSAFTWSAWIKPSTLVPNAILFSRRDGNNAFEVGVDNGVPFVEITTEGDVQRSPAGEALTANIWRHLAIVSNGTEITLTLDSEKYATLTAAIPALTTESTLGGTGFVGELDELEISKIGRPIGWLKLAAISQSGSEKANKLLAISPDEINEQHESEVSKQLSLIGDISKSLTFDGWVVIVLCAILALIGWVVTIGKFSISAASKKRHAPSSSNGRRSPVTSPCSIMATRKTSRASEARSAQKPSACSCNHRSTISITSAPTKSTSAPFAQGFADSLHAPCNRSKRRWKVA